MSLNPIPKIRTDAAPEDRSWNDHFYICLGKAVWVIAAVVLFAFLVMITLTVGRSLGLGSVLLLFITAFAAVYIVAAMPVSIIYAFRMKSRYKK